MGNVPISCCKSKSTKTDDTSSRGRKNSNASRNKSRFEETHDNQISPHILQHISEREPDDSETDPSSNPVDRPIFAARSCKLNYAPTNSIHSNNHSDDLSCTPNRNEKYSYPNNSTCSQARCSKSNNSPCSDDCQIDMVESFKTDNYLTKTNHGDETHHYSENGYKTYGENGVSDKDIHQNSNDNAMNTAERFINPNLLLRISSCSTIHCDGSTISQPNLKQTIKGVSLAIYFHIRNRTSDNYVEIFDETIYPLRMPRNVEFNEDEKDDQVDLKYAISDSEDELEKESILNGHNEDHDRLKEPDRRTIYNFVKTLFKAAQLSSEYAITTLVYLERLMTYAEMDLTPKTWRRMFLGAIVLSSKVWEDQAVWNVDYAQILEEISVEDINELERHFLGLIQFNMNVPSSVYAKYYFHLRTLALVNGISKRYSLMTTKEAKLLEAFSFNHYSDSNRSLPEKSTVEIKRHKSLYSVGEEGRSRAVLM